MRKISIQFDVQNSSDIVKKQKGKLAGFAAGILMSREKLKDKVEDAIAQELVKALQENISEKLAEQGVQATLVIEENR